MTSAGADCFRTAVEGCGLEPRSLALLAGADACVTRQWLSGAAPAPAHAINIVRLAARLSADQLQALIAECAAAADDHAAVADTWTIGRDPSGVRVYVHHHHTPRFSAQVRSALAHDDAALDNDEFAYFIDDELVLTAFVWIDPPPDDPVALSALLDLAGGAHRQSLAQRVPKPLRRVQW